jgi:hypothetical protein
MNPFNLDCIPFETFKGTFDRGRDEEVIPDHFIDSRNIKFSPKGVQSRDGSVPSIELTVPAGDYVARHYFKRAEGYGQVLMYLTLPTGNLYGIRNGITSLLHTNPAMIDFSITSTNNRIYFTPHNRIAGIAGEIIRYWDGTNVFAAAGPKPTAGSAMTATTSGTGVDAVQTLTIGGTASAGNMPINTKYGQTVPLPYNFSAAQLESALRGDNERQAVWIVNATGGTVITEFGGQVSAGVAPGASAATYKTDLEGISTIGAGNIDVLSGTGTAADPWFVLFIGSLAKQEQTNFILNLSGLTGTDPIAGYVQEVLKGRSLFGVGNVTVSGTNPYTITFVGDEGEQPQDLLNPVNNLTGVSPTVTVVSTVEGVTAGDIDAGRHKFAVIFETASGFLTGLGPLIAGVFTPTIYEAPGNHAVLIGNIPVGPTGTFARHILATKAGEEEYFFAPEGDVLDNVTTSVELSFFDSELVESADYLEDQLTEIPACLKFITYKSRAVLIGFPQPDGSLARFSRPGEVEAFDEILGQILVEPNDQHLLQTGFEFRDVLYFGKTLGWYSVIDNTLEPAEWDKPVTIDRGVAGRVFGISDIPNFLEGNTRDRYLVVDNGGLLLFDGAFHDPPLTWKIYDIWMRVNRTYLDKIQILDDHIHKRLYMNVVLGHEETEINAVIYGDYSECGQYPDPVKIKWTIWEFPCNPISITIFDLAGSGEPIFRYTAEDVIYRMCRAGDCHNDYGNPIHWLIRFPYVAPGDNMGEVNFFGCIRFRAEGIGNLDITYYGEDNLPVYLPPLIVASTAPAQELLRLTNFKAERCSVQVEQDELDEWLYITRMRLYGKMYAAQRPA